MCEYLCHYFRLSNRTRYSLSPFLFNEVRVDGGLLLQSKLCVGDTNDFPNECSDQTLTLTATYRFVTTLNYDSTVISEIMMVSNIHRNGLHSTTVDSIRTGLLKV